MDTMLILLERGNMSRENDKKKPIFGYEGLYEVTNTGQVYSVRSNRYLSQKKRSDGYMEVNLWRDNTSRSFLVHRLVAEAFIPMVSGLEQINHKDEIRSNNNANNLEWCNAKYNSNYGNNRKRGIYTRRLRHSNCKKVKCVETGIVYESIQTATSKTGVHNTNISRVLKGERNTAGGFHWEYA